MNKSSLSSTWLGLCSYFLKKTIRGRVVARWPSCVPPKHRSKIQPSPHMGYITVVYGWYMILWVFLICLKKSSFILILALFGRLEKRLILMLILICCKRKILLFHKNGTTDKFKRTRPEGCLPSRIEFRKTIKISLIWMEKYSWDCWCNKKCWVVLWLGRN
jgi:hypothetical protein